MYLSSVLIFLTTVCLPTVLCLNKSDSGWIPVFIAFSGNDQRVYDAWFDQNKCAPLPAKNYTDQSRHLRNPILDSWTSLNIQKVKVELFNNSCLREWLTFNGRFTTITDWFSQSNLMACSFRDLKGQKETVFDMYKKIYIEDDFIGWSFSFFIAGEDRLFLAVEEPYILAVDEPYIHKDIRPPTLMFQKTNQRYNFERAERMVISLMIEN